MDGMTGEALRRISDLRAHIEGYAARHAATRAGTDPAGGDGLAKALKRLTAALEVRDPAADDPLQRATAAIAFNLATPISLRKVAAKIAFVSPGHLSHLFKKRHGVSFQQYVQSLRLEKAARLLANTGLPIVFHLYPTSTYRHHECTKFDNPGSCGAFRGDERTVIGLSE